MIIPIDLQRRIIQQETDEPHSALATKWMYHRPGENSHSLTHGFSKSSDHTHTKIDRTDKKLQADPTGALNKSAAYKIIPRESNIRRRF